MNHLRFKIMKYILLFISIIFCAILHAQRLPVNQPFVTDTVQGAQTLYYGIAGNSAQVKSPSNTVSFGLTKTDVADSLSLLRIQGALKSDFSDAVNLTGNASLINTTTDGNTILYVTDSPYLYHRLAATCAAGDTVILTNVTQVVKYR